MADTPTPRSYNQILGEMLSRFLSKLGLKSLPVGDPVLSIMEAAAQSDLRSSQDIFAMLASTSLDQASGLALMAIGASENVAPLPAVAASGTVTIKDTSFVRVSSKLYHGAPAPIVGSYEVHVADASNFPSAGSIYLGRNTKNYEGPLAYVSATQTGAYWTLVLSAPTTRPHNTGEDVVLAQGGDRNLPSGTTVQTPQGNVQAAIRFTTLFGATLADGETELVGVQVVASQTGKSTNVAAGAITSFLSLPFPGATVTNPLPLTNGRSAETPEEYRERIRQARQSRSKGTALAIETALRGATAEDESKRIASVSIIDTGVARVIIDDGNGYEESSRGVDLEVLSDGAQGGERYFELYGNKPIAPAALVSEARAPFNIQPGDVLSVKVGTETTSHLFSRTLQSAYDIAADINSNSLLGWVATTADSGRRLRLTPRTDTSIQVVAAPATLELPYGEMQALFLYKNDELLRRDGTLASLSSTGFGSWAPLANGETLTLNVDGTGAHTYTFTAAHFDGTGFTSVDINNTEAWATAINAAIPGVTAVADSGTVGISSNRGANDRASLEITGGSLVTNGVFEIGSATGSTSDYTLDRATGQIELSSPLATGDLLAAGSVFLLPFWESSYIETVSVASNAVAYVVVDAPATNVELDLTPGDTISITQLGSYATITSSSATFSAVQVGDTVIITDSAFASQNRGKWTVSQATPNTLSVSTLGMSNQSVGITSASALSVVRTQGKVQTVVLVAPAQHTATSIASELDTQLVGAASEEVNNTRYRIYSESPTGSVQVVAANVEAIAAGLNPHAGVSNPVPVASVTSEFASTPEFSAGKPTSTVTPTSTSAVLNSLTTAEAGDTISWLTDLQATPNTLPLGWRTDILSASAYTLSFDSEDRPWSGTPTASIHSGLSLGPTSEFVVTLDNDPVNKRFVVPLQRKLVPEASVYGVTNNFLDASNGDNSLADAFGLDGDFTGFKALMSARAITAIGTDHAILWRYKQKGQIGEAARVSIQYATGVGTPVSVNSVSQSVPDDIVDVKVHLPAGASKPSPTLPPNTAAGFWASPSVVDGETSVQMVLQLPATNIARTSNSVTVTLSAHTPPSGSSHGIQVGDIVYLTVADAAFGAGPHVVASVTSNTVSYNEVGVDAVSVAVTAIRVGSPMSSWTSASPAPVAGDLVVFGPNSGVPVAIQGMSCLITSVTPETLVFNAPVDVTALTSSAWDWNKVVDHTAIAFVNPPSIDTDALVAAVNALPNSPVTATNVSGANGTITQSTLDEEGVVGLMLEDGHNVVSVSLASASPTYSLTFANPVSSTLAGAADADWQNEEVVIVPGNMESLVRWMNYDAASNLHNSANIALTADGQLLITSSTPGSKGAVTVEGGRGNLFSVPVRGSVTPWGNTVVVNVPSANVADLSSGYVTIENQTVVPRSIPVAGTTITVSNGEVTLSSGGVVVNTLPSRVVAFVKDGDFMVAQDLSGSFASSYITPGSYISFPSATGANVGPHKVEGSNGARVWFRGTGIEEISTTSVVSSPKVSPQVGDTLALNNILGASASYLIDSVGPTYFTTIPVIPDSSATVVTPGQVRIIEGTPASYIKRVISVSPVPNSTYSAIKLSGPEGSEIGEASGGTLVGLGRINAPTDNRVGVDAYRESTGLMAEAGRILYGVSDDAATYPGVVAAGAKVSLSGPLIRRVSISVSVRARAGVSTADVRSRVQSAVAAVINDSPVGSNIAISNVVSAAADVNGVVAVTVLNPTYGPGEDLILVQPDEKAMVLDLNDVSVNFVGGA